MATFPVIIRVGFEVEDVLDDAAENVVVMLEAMPEPPLICP
jgi:hypothetical protein